MRRFLASVLSLIALTILNPFPSVARAVEPLQAVLDCSTDNSTFCIEAIYASKSDGAKVKGQLNGKISTETRAYAPQSILTAKWQEYVFDGITFDNGYVKTAMPRIFYFPMGNQDCFYTPCVQGNEYLETVLTPGSRTPGGPQPKVFPPTSESCVGKTYYPGSPVPTEFGPGVKFDVRVRVPNNVMQTLGSGGLGRGLSSAGVTFESPNSDYTVLNMELEPSEYSGYGCNGAVLATRGDFENDQITYWIWGLSDSRMQNFGTCRSIKSGVSVVSNAFWDNFPEWDSKNGSLNVALSGPHLKSDGSINYVNFQAKISTALAQCLWGVDLTKQSKAQISLLYDSDGQSQTQTYTGQLVNDQYVVNVEGIHLSSPTVSLKFVQSEVATPAPTPTVVAVQAKAVGPVLPNSKVTPGAINPAVTQENIGSTICTIGYTKKIRPPSSYTTKLKIQQLNSLPYSAFGSTKTSLFEEDHLISLELGGSPTSPKNLWPEPYAGSTGARKKDQLENKLHLLVCSHQISLKKAQVAIATNWYAAYQTYVLGIVPTLP